MATGGPKYDRSMKIQKQATYKRSSDEGQTANSTCKCRGCKKTVCQYCKKSAKKFKFLKGKTTDNPEVVPKIGGRKLGSRYWDVQFSEYFSNSFKKVLEMKPEGWCHRIRLFNNKIWAPIISGNVVNVFNKKGKIQKTIDIKTPKSVEQVENGDIFIACHSNSGLYVLDAIDFPLKICEGSFADVYAYRDKVYTLEYEKKLIMEFCCLPDVGDVKQRWISENKWSVDEASLYDTLIVTGDAVLQLYVAHWNSHKVSQYNTQGQCIRQFGGRHEAGDGNLYWPWLCGVDRQSYLLVTERYKNMFKILDPSTGQWKSTEVRGVPWAFDATIDGNGSLWLSQYGRKNCIITKHEPQ